MKTKQNGFTLIEIVIALSIGLFLFAGVISIFIGMRTTTSETTSLGALQENARFALSVVTDDLMRQDFWGDLNLSVSFDNTIAVGLPVIAVGNDCIGQGINNATFPLAVGAYRTLWGVSAINTSPIACINNAVVGSDLLQIKRVLSLPIVGATDPSRFYLVANAGEGRIFPGGAITPVINNGRVWEYQHHIYYVTNQAQGGNNVPVLMQGRLRNVGAGNAINFQPLIDGIEQIKFMYGVDNDDDGVVNGYISAVNMTNAFWDTSKVLAVKVYILARDILPDNDYINTNTYQLGDVLLPAFNDNFRRLLLTSTVTLHNSGVQSWTP